jgi:hypothetical protein
VIAILQAYLGVYYCRGEEVEDGRCSLSCGCGGRAGAGAGLGFSVSNFTSWTDRPWHPALPLQSALGKPQASSGGDNLTARL